MYDNVGLIKHRDFYFLGGGGVKGRGRSDIYIKRSGRSFYLFSYVFLFLLMNVTRVLTLLGILKMKGPVLIICLNEARKKKGVELGFLFIFPVLSFFSLFSLFSDFFFLSAFFFVIVVFLIFYYIIYHNPSWSIWKNG